VRCRWCRRRVDLFVHVPGPDTATGPDQHEKEIDMSTTTVYRVTGMTCGHCVSAVTSEVSAIEGVHDVQVELATGDVTVSSDRPLDHGAVAAAVDEAGYQLAS
jgi:copper chaperone CopZ